MPMTLSHIMKPLCMQVYYQQGDLKKGLSQCDAIKSDVIYFLDCYWFYCERFAGALVIVNQNSIIWSPCDMIHDIAHISKMLAKWSVVVDPLSVFNNELEPVCKIWVGKYFTLTWNIWSCGILFKRLDYIHGNSQINCKTDYTLWCLWVRATV